MRKLIFILIALISFSQAQTIQYIGAPTTTVISRGNFRTDSIFYLPKRTKTPTDTAAFRYQISDSSLYYWTGYQWTKVQSASSFSSVDTLVISTRLWRQKGIDSVQYNVGLKVNISDTSSMLSPYIRHAGYGLTKTSQALSVDTALMATRLRVGKVVDSLSLVKQNVLTNPVTGTGTTNYVPKFTGTSTIGNSQIFDNGTNIGFAVTPKTWFGSRKAIEINGGGALTGVTNLFMELYGNAYLDGSINHRYINNGSAGLYGIGNLASGVSSHTFYVAPNGTAGNTLTFTPALNILSNGRVGINTTTDAGAYTLQNNGALYNTGSAIIAATSGNVGIGTTSPNSKLELSDGLFLINQDRSIGWNVAGSATLRAYIIGTSGNELQFWNRQGGINTQAVTINASGESLFGTTTDAGNYRVQVSGNAYVTGDAILAASSGSVGIGVTSPSYKLDVRTSAVNDVALLLTSAGGGSYLLFADGNTVTAPKIGGFGDQIFFQTSNTTRARINTSGNFLLGTTNNLARLTVQESFTTDVAHFSTVTSGSYLIFADGNTTSAPKLGAVTNSLAFITSGTEKARFHANGGLKYVPQSAAPTAEAGTVYYDSDDNKLKVYNGTTWVDLH